MAARKTASNLKVTTSPQLDLFSQSIKPPSAQVVATVIQPIVVVPAPPPVTAAVVRDPLLDFILDKPRGRGRPEKELRVGDEANDDFDADESAKDLVDVREAARRLGLSKSTLDKMRCSGRGPIFIRATDRSIRYDPKDLAAFRKQRRRRTTSDLAGLLVE